MNSLDRPAQGRKGPWLRHGLARIWKAVKRWPRPGADRDRLSAHLRADMGIDAAEVERDRVRKAPLIR